MAFSSGIEHGGSLNKIIAMLLVHLLVEQRRRAGASMEHDLFDRVGFKFEYRKEMERFYRPFFSSNEELEQFFVEVFQLENKDLRPRQMINQICRFVTLANDIEQIRPGRDPLRILFPSNLPRVTLQFRSGLEEKIRFI